MCIRDSSRFVPPTLKMKVHDSSITSLQVNNFSTANTKSKGKGGLQTVIQYLLLFPIAYGSLLAGASLTHSILKPDLTIPNLEEEIEGEEATDINIKVSKEGER